VFDERRHVCPTGSSRWEITVQGFPDSIDASTLLLENVLRHTSYPHRMNVFSPTREPSRKVRVRVNQSVRSTNAVKLVSRSFLQLLSKYLCVPSVLIFFLLYPFCNLDPSL